MKLVGVERTLGIIRHDNFELDKEIILNLPLELLKDIVKPKNHDNYLYLPYKLNKNQLGRLLKHLDMEINADFDSFLYVLECNGKYEELPIHPPSSRENDGPAGA
jgi:hypothetical protein